MDYSSVSSVSAREFVPAAVPAKGTLAPAQHASANDEPFSFWDLLDLVNPLQHIPIVNTIYREATGDTIKTPMKIIGSTIIGGPIGFASAMVDGLVEKSTGKDMGAHAMSVFKQPAADGSESGETQFADAREFIPSPLAGEVSETAIADAREFIPRTVAAPIAMAAVEAVSEQEALAAGNDLLRLAALREERATRFAAALQPRETNVAAAQQPSQAEAMIAAAQIAAKAHVRVPAVAAAQPNTPQQLAAADGGFMPLKAAAAQQRPLAAPRVNAVGANSAELSSLMARTKYAPGVRGNRDITPAIMAQAAKPRSAPTAAAAASQYERARQAAAGNIPQEMPGWFDEAMLATIDKYKAMKTSTPGL